MFGPPKDRAEAIAVLREAVASGVDHIDTSDFYGPHVVNQIIREALHPYPADLTIVTKVGAVRGDDASWNPAISPEQLESAVHDNLRNLGLEALDVVNYRVMGEVHAPAEGSIEVSSPPSPTAATGADPPSRPQQRLVNPDREGARHCRDRLRAEPLQPRPPPRRRADR